MAWDIFAAHFPELAFAGFVMVGQQNALPGKCNLKIPQHNVHYLSATHSCVGRAVFVDGALKGNVWTNGFGKGVGE